MFQNFFIDTKYADLVAAALRAAHFEISGDDLRANGYLAVHVENLYLLQAAEISIRVIIDCEHGTDEESRATLENANRLLEFFYR